MFEFKQRFFVIFLITFAALPFNALRKGFSWLSKAREMELREQQEAAALEEKQALAQRLQATQKLS